MKNFFLFFIVILVLAAYKVNKDLKDCKHNDINSLSADQRLDYYANANRKLEDIITFCKTIFLIIGVFCVYVYFEFGKYRGETDWDWW